MEFQSKMATKSTFQPHVTMATEGLQSPNLAGHRYSRSSIDCKFENARFVAESAVFRKYHILTAVNHIDGCHVTMAVWFGNQNVESAIDYNRAKYELNRVNAKGDIVLQKSASIDKFQWHHHEVPFHQDQQTVSTCFCCSLIFANFAPFTH